MFHTPVGVFRQTTPQHKAKSEHYTNFVSFYKSLSGEAYLEIKL